MHNAIIHVGANCSINLSVPYLKPPMLKSFLLIEVGYCGKIMASRLRSVMKLTFVFIIIICLILIGRNLWPIFVQLRCHRFTTYFFLYESIDFYMLSPNFHCVTSKNLQFFCNLRLKTILFI